MFKGRKLKFPKGRIKPRVLNIQRVNQSNIGDYICKGTDDYGHEFYAQSTVKVKS